MARTIPAMVNMARSKEEKAESVAMTAVDAVPDYPYGLCICLCQNELEKLGLEDEDVQIGDMIHLHAMATVTSISKQDSQAMGPSCRIELQITNLASLEDEDEENTKMNATEKMSKLYTSK